ncbi:type II toxin-antitoxin system PemK/MazF family toxin (plasmid) [Bacteroides ovatus]|nr:type II toxin-antitoxin system PemK/MazF family toxin [Bacteroides ovatus]
MVEQYEVYWVELDPTRGGEMAKTRTMCSCHSFRFEYVPYNSSHCSDNLNDKKLSLPGSVFCSRA